MLQRGLATYRRDLVPLAYRKLALLHRFKKLNKRNNFAEDKKASKK